MNNIISETLDGFSDIDKNVLSYPISLIFMNIRSLRANFNSLIASINCIIDQIKIIVLVETNINDDENNLYNIPGFNATFFNRPVKRGGGVAVFIKNNIAYNNITINTTSYEILKINILTEEQISLLAIYRPPSHNPHEFIRELDDILKTVKKQRNVIMVGDINIDIMKENTVTTLYLDTLTCNGMQLIINDYTREVINQNTRTCIDHLFVRMKNVYTQLNSSIIKTNISDHYTIFFSYSYHEEITNRTKTTTQQTIVNNFKVNHLIRSTNWHDIENTNPLEYYNAINEKFKIIYESTKIKSRKTKTRISSPWISEELMQNCRTRDKLYKKWYLNKNNVQKENEYKKYRNTLNKKLKYEKNLYYKQKLYENRNNIRKTWQIINEIIGKKSMNLDESVINNFKNTNTIDLCNNFAVNFKTNVEKTIHLCKIQTIDNTQIRLQNSLYLHETDEIEIFNILNTLNIKKSAGFDTIRPIDLKNNACILTPIVTKLINLIVNSSVIPEDFKISYVRPIFKSGIKSDVNNYRPIAILPVFEKIMEEIIGRRLKNFLSQNKIINANQFGFQKDKSINKLLGNFANYINGELSKNHHCLTLFVDFSKAFDTLSHKKLLLILERIGVRGHCLEWFKNYLSLRKYYVKILNNVSKEINVEHGVPQGSKLGPLLYIIYTNELINTLKFSKVFAYADDTAIVVAHKDLETATNLMQHQFDMALKWCHDYGLIINASKTKLMHIKPPHFKYADVKLKFHTYECLHKNNLMEFDYNNDNCLTHIEIVNTYKYLGVYVDQSFKWREHIENVRKKLRKASYILYHLSFCSNTRVMRQVYFSLAESHIRHGVTAWGSSSCCRKLQQTQNHLLRILKSHITANHRNENTTHQNSNSIAKDLNILNVQNIYKVSIAIDFFNDSRFLQAIRHNYGTRMNEERRLLVERYRNEYGRRALSVVIPNIFNNMPLDVLRNSTNSIHKKKILKNYFISTQ